MRANPDGYTIQIGHMGTHAAAPSFYPNLAYRPDADFAPIGMVALTAYVIAANKNFPPNDLKEFIAYAKANHEKLNMGHAGVGSNTHLTGLLFNAILGLKPALVPFNSAAAATNAMIAGHVDYMSAAIADAVASVCSTLEAISRRRRVAARTRSRRWSSPTLPAGRRSSKRRKAELDEPISQRCQV